MKFRLCVITLCAALLFLLTGCYHSENDTAATETSTAPVRSVSPEAAQTLYQQALDKLSAFDDYKLNITVSKTTSVGAEVFSETRQQVLTYNHFGSKDMQASLEETCTIGSQSTSVYEYYADNTGYFTVNGSHFKSDITAEAYIARNIPAAPLDISLYKSISAQEQDRSVSIQCSQPSRGERWALPNGGNMTVASGTILLDATGALAQSTYNIVYTYGPASVDLSVTVSIDTNAASKVQIPSDTASFIPLAHPDAPRMLEQACGYLLQSDLLSANITSSITCQAGGIHRVEATQLHMDSQAADFSAALDTSVKVIDYSRGGEASYYTQKETFLDGQYGITADSSITNRDDNITPEAMQTYCQDLLVSSVLLPDYIATATLTDLGSVYLLELTASQEFALILCDAANQTLYGDPQFLSSLSSSSEIGAVDCYLAIDKYTGLPTAAGYRCDMEYVIEDFTYTFRTQTDAGYSLASLTAQSAITGVPEVSANTPQPTPLFYHVTGDKGQSLWLLGTIHAGDARANNLPQEIYDALQQSDALAVEFDTETVDTQIATDSQPQSALFQACCYTNDTTADHLDAALYETALKLMKASGSYTADTVYLKPVFWEAEISNFYLRQGYQLTTEQAVDSHLIQQAKSAGKEILNIESLLAQAQMLGNLSDPLQEALLTETVSYDGFSYHTDTAKLFDLWCQGDKTALQTMVTANLTLTDTALNDEYANALLTQRNTAMLSTATEYLESGKTIFFAVGLAHLLEENGLLAALQDAGYSVTQVTYP